MVPVVVTVSAIPAELLPASSAEVTSVVESPAPPAPQPTISSIKPPGTRVSRLTIEDLPSHCDYTLVALDKLYRCHNNQINDQLTARRCRTHLLTRRNDAQLTSSSYQWASGPV